MDDFKAFRLYTSIKVHFTQDKFDLFSSTLKGGRASYERRRDKGIFKKWASEYDTVNFINLVAANCMYGNTECAYDMDRARDNYKEYERRRQAITKIFSDDLDKIDCLNEQELIQKMVGNQITIETCVILHEVLGLFMGEMPSIFDTALRRIRKSRRFVRYNRSKIESVLKQRGYMNEVNR